MWSVMQLNRLKKPGIFAVQHAALFDRKQPPSQLKIQGACRLAKDDNVRLVEGGVVPCPVKRT